MALKTIEEYERELDDVMRRLGNARKVVAAQRGAMFAASRDKFIADMENEVFRLRSLLNVMRKDKALKDQADAVKNMEAKGGGEAKTANSSDVSQQSAGAMRGAVSPPISGADEPANSKEAASKKAEVK